MKLYAPSTIREIREKYGFRLSKSLGQNFLTDKNIIDDIIDGAAIGAQDLVIEIGPGIGVLTWEAAQLAQKVIAVEIDKNLIPILAETLREADNIEVINQDILKTDINTLIEREKAEAEAAGMPYAHVRIIGNLPYYITTPIIMKLLEDGIEADSMTVMMQKEVADRMRAHPGTKAYGALSVAVQYYCEAEQVVNVPAKLLRAAAKGGLGSTAAGYAHRASGRAGGSGYVLSLCQGGVWPAAQNTLQCPDGCGAYDQRDRGGISRGGGDRSGKKSRDSGPCGICKTCKRSRKEIS